MKTPAAEAANPPALEIRDGRLLLPRATYERCLAGCDHLVLLAQDDGWWLLPIRGGAGALPIKQRNAQGDRVVEAREFLRRQGQPDDAPPQRYTLEFAAARGGFRLVATKR